VLPPRISCHSHRCHSRRCRSDSQSDTPQAFFEHGERVDNWSALTSSLAPRPRPGRGVPPAGTRSLIINSSVIQTVDGQVTFPRVCDTEDRESQDCLSRSLRPSQSQRWRGRLIPSSLFLIPRRTHEQVFDDELREISLSPVSIQY
jgi:hypothetical protein